MGGNYQGRKYALFVSFFEKYTKDSNGRRGPARHARAWVGPRHRLLLPHNFSRILVGS